ncbi:MAG: hydantoinase/oxoprolinase family protein [Nitrospinota bacterium]|nr:MAG: hydantoinase/oxoprolinase family protein [Nitrospinota bacterium]
MGIRVGIDIGGTFTDILALDATGKLSTLKVLSTPEDFSQGILRGLERLLPTFADTIPEEVIHGTTVATNAILEQKGAKTGLITTRGFRDVLEIRRIRMPELYNLRWEKPKPLVERRWRLEVGERIDHRGEILVPLQEDEVEQALEKLRREGVTSVAVCLINSFLNPVHEQQIGAFIRERYSDLYCSLSHQILPEIKEYERTSTTVINAYVMPVVQQYLDTLEQGLRRLGYTRPLLIMQSNGGIMSATVARERPVHIIESGPAAGVIGAAAVSRKCGYPNVITLDMGGTTAKASIIEGGLLSRSPEYEVGGGITVGSRLIKGGGYLVRAPVIDIAEVGAGGGSIAWIDKGGHLQVGPQSAGAIPGPICYNQGGEEPTLTDANLLLGYLNPAYLVGGALALEREKAARILSRKIATPLSRSLPEAAYGVHILANASMMRAVRAVSTERGRDPRDFALMAFGGNGPVHAAALAQALEMKTVIIPPFPGVFSAFGLLVSEVEHHHVQTYYRSLHRLDLAEFNGMLATLEAELRETLSREGYAAEAMVIERAVDLRYAGQSFELTVPLDPGIITATTLEKLATRFGEEHQKTYGHKADNEPIELVNLRLVARGLPTRPRFPEQLQPDTHALSLSPSRPVYFGTAYGEVETPIRSRESLGMEGEEGPMIIEEYDATIVVPPECRVKRDAWHNVIITLP